MKMPLRWLIMGVAGSCNGFLVPRGEGGYSLISATEIGMCGPKGYGFSALLVINRVSILADFGHFGINRVWFLHSNLDRSITLRGSHFFIIIEKKINTKAFYKLCLW